jgi:arylsulfatase A-like enzyme
MEALAAQGVRFQHAYAFPTCSPSRAAMLTGRYPTRYGVGNAIDDTETWGLPLAEITLPEMLRESPHAYTSVLIGKWHLASFLGDRPVENPLDQGFDWHEGSLENLGKSFGPSDRKRNYTHWEKSTNGSLAFVEDYATTVTVDDALEAMDRTPEPWFMTVAFNAPHKPLHVPPPELHSYDEQGITTGCEPEWICYNAMVEALDTELGRLLDTMDPDLASRTTIILTSDNGTPDHGILEPFDPERSKGTVFDGGVWVPLVVAGPLVQAPGATSDALVSVMDIFATVAEIAEVDLSILGGAEPIPIDAVSFVPQIADPTLPGRDLVVSETFRANGPPPWRVEERMVRSGDHKLRRRNGREQFFAYRPDQVDEGVGRTVGGDTLSTDERLAYQTLRAELDLFEATVSYDAR